MIKQNLTRVGFFIPPCCGINNPRQMRLAGLVIQTSNMPKYWIGQINGGGCPSCVHVGPPVRPLACATVLTEYFGGFLLKLLPPSSSIIIIN
ncbi:hypothetical protein F8388_022333 [Cannabis sativa]|uniref:Uncharacterized protein n=1 Tax=Cannabis sativa TaxID=3483 RepID=A0A7J6G6V0_CANSA|nr:hypothetical protein F8388_022333 [Cannabis sativa]